MSTGCLVHLDGTLLTFTTRRFTTFMRHRQHWLQILVSSPLSAVALETLKLCPDDLSVIEGVYANFCYHEKCYNTFTDISKQQRAIGKCDDIAEDPIPDTTITEVNEQAIKVNGNIGHMAID